MRNIKTSIRQVTLQFSSSDADLIAWFALSKMTASRLIKAAMYAYLENKAFRLPEIAPISMLNEQDMKKKFNLHLYEGEEPLVRLIDGIDNGMRSSFIKNLIRNCMPSAIPIEYTRAAYSFYKKTKSATGLNNGFPLIKQTNAKSNGRSPAVKEQNKPQPAATYTERLNELQRPTRQEAEAGATEQQAQSNPAQNAALSKLLGSSTFQRPKRVSGE